jgi:diketogulonate reductase-like aldo/keto reductase
MQSFTLNDGVTIPAVEFGVFQTPPDETAGAVEQALVRAGLAAVSVDAMLTFRIPE